MYHLASIKGHFKGMMAAHKEKASRSLFKKVTYFQDYNPEPREYKYSTKTELTFDKPHYSSLTVSTAGDDDLGRAENLQYFHGSECSIWPNCEETLLSVLQTVASEVDTTVILESTANGMGGEWYRRWCQATPADLSPILEHLGLDSSKGAMELPKGNPDDTDFYAIFLPWHVFPDYALSDSQVPKDFTPTNTEHAFFGDEASEQLKYGLSNNQLMWRRKCILNNCGGDIDKFRQEYPACDKEAFLVSGRPVFPLRQLDSLEKRCKEPLIKGSIEYRDGETLIHSNERGHLELWEHPLAGEVYAIGADVSEGLVHETRNTDAHSAHVIKISTGETVAKLSGRYDPDLYGNDLVILTLYYNNAHFAFEANNTCGGEVRSAVRRHDRFEDLENLYYHEVPDGDGDRMTKKMGHVTDKTNRGTLIGDLKIEIRSMRISIYSKISLQQCQTFVYNDTGKAEASPGEYDDDVMSLAITWMVALKAIEGGFARSNGGTGHGVNNPAPERKRPEFVIGGYEDESRYIDADPDEEYDDEYDDEY